MFITTLKIVISVSLFLLVFVVSNLPFLIIKKLQQTIDPQRRRWYAIAVSLMSCFAGGVFLGTGLLHLLPEVGENIDSISADLNIPTKYPSAEFLMVFGFLLMLTVEQITLSYHENQEDPGETAHLLGHRHGHHQHTLPNRHNSLEGISSHSQSSSSGRFSRSNSVQDEQMSIHADPSSHSLLRSLILVGALLFHSLFEGLAIGLQSSKEDTLATCLAVSLHKTVLAFSVGLNLAQSALSSGKILLSNTLFALSSPLGILIGLGIIDLGETPAAVTSEAVLQGIACGTFIYVTFFEVLPHEFNNPQCRLGKLLMLILGFGCVAGMMFLEPEIRNS